MFVFFGAQVSHLICFFCSHELIRIHWRCYPSECPRIVVNPKPSLVAYRADEVPQEALPDVALDEPFVKDVDPKTWVVTGVVQKPTSFPLSNELPIAEKFRLAFAERDARLAPKRAKNARQHQRRAERDWMMSSDKAKAIFFGIKGHQIFAQELAIWILFINIGGK